MDYLCLVPVVLVGVVMIASVIVAAVEFWKGRHDA